jgi:hypothetical protein
MYLIISSKTQTFNLRGPSLSNPTVRASVLSLSLGDSAEGPASLEFVGLNTFAGSDPRAVPCFSYTHKNISMFDSILFMKTIPVAFGHFLGA